MNQEMDLLIKEINFLANKKKIEGLTDEELVKQKALRDKYIEIFRKGFRQELEHIRVIDSQGNDVTPRKMRKVN